MLKSTVLVLLMATFIHVNASEATENPAPATLAPPATAPATDSTAPLSWNQLLQRKYNLNDAQMTALADSKLAEPQMAMAAQLAKSSGKTVEEVLKMQAESKTGWGNLAKQLGVDPKELGQAVSSLKHERNADRKKMKDTAKTEHREDKELHEKKEKHEKRAGFEKKEHPKKDK